MSQEGAVPLWTCGWEGRLDCGLLPICKVLFQYFIHHLGCAGSVNSDRTRLFLTEEERHRDRNKGHLICQAGLWLCC